VIGRDDRNETSAAFAIEYFNKRQAIIEKSGCKHCSYSGNDESKCFKIVNYLLVRELGTEEEAVKGAVMEGHRTVADEAKQPTV